MKAFFAISALSLLLSACSFNQNQYTPESTSYAQGDKQEVVPEHIPPLPLRPGITNSPKDLYNQHTCVTCHDQTRHQFKHKAAEVSCKNCHTRHGLPNHMKAKLRHSVNQSCMICHHKREFHRKETALQNHPMKKQLDNHQEFNCVTCHNPHSSTNANLMTFDYSQKTPYKNNVCSYCHWSTVYDGPPPKVHP